MSNKPSYEELEKRVQELEAIEFERRKTEEEFAHIFSMSLDMICTADINTATFIKVNLLSQKFSDTARKSFSKNHF